MNELDTLWIIQDNHKGSTEMTTTQETLFGTYVRKEETWSLLSLRIGTKWLVALVISLVAVSLLLGSASAQEVTTHRVAAGETLSSIARLYGVSTLQLQQYNGITNPNVIRTGQILRIPPAGRTVVAPPSPRSTPTPSALTPPTSVLATPTTASSNATVIAPPVYTPVPTPTPNPNCVLVPSFCVRTHTVRSGDTLTGIALSYGVTVSALKIRNNLRSDLIFVGQRLIIP
jgi:LysM repeat protein